MSKINECEYVELYEVICSNLELIGSRAVLVIYLGLEGKISKEIHIAISNVAKFLSAFRVKSIVDLNKQMIRCLINPYKEVNYITPMDPSEWIICKEVHYNG